VRSTDTEEVKEIGIRWGAKGDTCPSEGRGKKNIDNDVDVREPISERARKNDPQIGRGIGSNRGPPRLKRRRDNNKDA